MHTALSFLDKRAIQTNPSTFDDRLFSEVYLRTLCLKQGNEYKINILRQEMPEGRSSEGYTGFTQVKPWPWHVAVIPGVSLVTHSVVPGSLLHFY